MGEVNKRKQRIIDAAIEVLKESSIEETTVRKIALKAGLTTGSLYHHYKNKDEIMFDVMKQSLQFTHKMVGGVKDEIPKKGKELLSEIVSEVSKRLSKIDEQKLHILLLSDVIARERPIKNKYLNNYSEIIKNTAHLFEEAFQIENNEYEKSVASILVAAVDGIAIQQALGVLPEDLNKTIDTFNAFFTESIPLFLQKHMG
ncbi:TetR/AcrR family transcriptional regulator [Aminipila terrae]|uniref:TetR family transcriptional regulator n=1 Tax=Aminipila terrae TaxID=2697030 RepID=A0A6P1MHR1_9FIRM|nr:TetR/AcrR family transcriptional regulator [Aminipila terrae]QHI71538.1 TetR family transcriptional regulator [Aminipila terrae]